MRIIREYGLQRSGITYQDMGYRTVEGDIPAWKLDEHELCDTYYRQALEDAKR